MKNLKLISIFLLTIISLQMNAQGYKSFKVAVYCRAYEVEKMADRVAIIDLGKIITIGTIAEIKEQSQTATLEEAFLKLTGKKIREEKAGRSDFMHMRRR